MLSLAGGETFTVFVGGEDQLDGILYHGFYPGEVSVNVNDTVVFFTDSVDPHAIQFYSGKPKVLQ